LERARKRTKTLTDAGMHSMWKRFDSQWMKPIFGGRADDPLAYIDGVEDEEEEALTLMGNGGIDNVRSPTKQNGSHPGRGAGGGAFLAVAPGKKDLRLGLGGSTGVRYHPPVDHDGML